MTQVPRVGKLISEYVAKQQALKHLNAFINLPSAPLSNDPVRSEGPLNSHYIAVKDNICTSNLPTTCASPGLRDFVSPYNATVVERLIRSGAKIAGKANLDEFGMGSHSLHSYFGAVKTLDGGSAGGSSGGSAVAVATGQCSAALGTDTGGSVRLPAAYNGVVGFKPSYGLVSRWGLVAYANSLDTVGFLGPDVDSVKQFFETCNSYDANDPTSLSPHTRERIASLIKARGSKKKLRIGIPGEYNVRSLSPAVRTSWAKAFRHLQRAGHSLHTVSIPRTLNALPIYYILAPAEASSNLAKYDAVRYGAPSRTSPEEFSDPVNSPKSLDQSSIDLIENKSSPGNNLYTSTRGAFFGPEVQRRILVGAYTLSSEAMNNYFVRATKIRRLISQDFDHVFSLPNPLRHSPGDVFNEQDEGVDYLLTPTAPSPPPKIEELEAMVKQDPIEQYTADVFTVPASLAGLPAVSVPSEEKGVGMQIMGQLGDDNGVLDLAKNLLSQ